MSNLQKFQLQFSSLVKSMRECSHHFNKENLNSYHLEGDVFAHSMLVLKQVEGTNLELAALLHDIGKTETRYENLEKKRVAFHGHESMSAFMALSIMKHWQIPQAEREQLFKLIATHGDPYRVDWAEMNKRLTNDPILAAQLFQFGLADHNGRFHLGEQNHKTVRFVPEKREIVTKNKEVVYLVALPGSGKTSYIEKNLKNHAVVSRDEIVETLGDPLKGNYNTAWKNVDQKQVDKELNLILKEATTKDKVVIDMTNLTRKPRRTKLSLFPDHYKKAIVLLPDLLTTFKRCEARKDKTISPDVIHHMITGFSLPDLGDFDEVVWIFE